MIIAILGFLGFLAGMSGIWYFHIHGDSDNYWHFMFAVLSVIGSMVCPTLAIAYLLLALRLSPV